MRGFIAFWWFGAVLVPLTWPSDQWPALWKLLAFYAGGLVITAVLWLATVMILKVAASK